ncbi:helix-turn-helix domain-containing protein [Mesorhizobium sp. M0902]|uniref:helix-turn-helix domain-containing protein n=1 Tax=Mesorhizobium sp. M0902 TaxID=2957021 RepID=UPI00333631F0
MAHIALTGDYLWNEIDRPLERFTRSALTALIQTLSNSLSGYYCRNAHGAPIKAARERGRKGGRRPKLTPDQRSEIMDMLNEGRPAAEIARLFRVHRATVGRIGAEVKIAVR